MPDQEMVWAEPRVLEVPEPELPEQEWTVPEPFQIALGPQEVLRILAGLELDLQGPREVLELLEPPPSHFSRIAPTWIVSSPSSSSSSSFSCPSCLLLYLYEWFLSFQLSRIRMSRQWCRR